MSIKINLSKYPERFATNSHELSIEKKVNFIFGKNGTGKTTIADEIENQLSDSYDVLIFKDFEGIVGDNARLDAVALGTANTTIQSKIDEVDAEIKAINEQIKQPKDKAMENLFTLASIAKKKCDDSEREIRQFFTTSAAHIKNQEKPQIAKTTYNANAFLDDIQNANLLSDSDIAKHKKNIAEEEKAITNKLLFNSLNLIPRLELVNKILQSSVEQPKGISELEDNVEKQKFAETGMKIHKHENGEICAFCGNEISDQRWQLLGNYFNDEYKKLLEKVNPEIAELERILKRVTEIGELVESDFYSQYFQDAKNLNLQIKVRKSEIKDFFDKLISALKDKRDNLFVLSDVLDIVVPNNFYDIQQIYNDLIESQAQFTKNLKTEQIKSKDALRYHEVKKKLDEFEYYNKRINLDTLETAKNETQNNLQSKKNELNRKEDERKDLISQTKDEEKIAIKINRLLTNMGVSSFSLKLVNSDSENQKGQYQISGHDGKLRPIAKLSKGEKNIIAFLYFAFNLESIEHGAKARIIVFDDPMTSNDDTMQYLMIGEIQKLYQNLKDDSYIILLTHNCHFYLNVRPPTMPKYKKSKVQDGLHEEVAFYEKYGICHLLSDGKRTSIKNM